MGPARTDTHPVLSIVRRRNSNNGKSVSSISFTVKVQRVDITADIEGFPMNDLNEFHC